MRGRREFTLIVGVAMVSMTLTLLTFWAVYEQGEALLAREWSDWRGRAAADAEQQRSQFRSDAQRACDAVAFALQRGGIEDVDQWAARPSIWSLTLVSDDGQSWNALPLAPCTAPLPIPTAESGRTSTDPRPVGEGLIARVGALVAAASRGEPSGPPSTVVRLLTEAGSQLVARPGYVRLALCAELVRVDALIADGERARAGEALHEFFARARAAHPARFGPDELRRIEQQIRGLAGEPPALRDALQRELVPFRARVERREALVAALRRTLADAPSETRPPLDDLALLSAILPDGEPVTIVKRSLGATGVVALALLESDLYRTYLRPPADAVWRLIRGGLAPAGDRWLRLDAPFASAILTPSPDVQERFASLDRRRLLMLCATASGTGGGWVIVIWLMMRAIARQREYARLQSRFVADISHELKTPLAMIRLLSETLLERRVHDPERVRRYHETITRESERLTALLDNILDIGRVESGRKTYTFDQCDVGDVARRAWALFEQQFARDGFDARLDIASDLPRIRADAAALQQVLVNLLQNAHRYGGQGKFVRLGVRRQEHVLELEVEDHGIGMTRSELNRLGQTFFRADDSRVRQQRGTGLGLAIVRHIISAHQGKVEVHSRPNEGTRFTVWIPIETGAAQAAGSSGASGG
jgi:two-component system phosphate regulon sensor histidine kinase PhoR